MDTSWRLVGLTLVIAPVLLLVVKVSLRSFNGLARVDARDEQYFKRGSPMLLRLFFLYCIFVGAELLSDQPPIGTSSRNANISLLLPHYADANCRELANDLVESLQDITRRFFAKRSSALSLITLSEDPWVLRVLNRLVESLKEDFVLVIGYWKGRVAIPASIQDTDYIILVDNWTQFDGMFPNSNLKHRQRYALARVARPTALGSGIQNELASQERLLEEAAFKFHKEGYVNLIFLRAISRGIIDVKSYDTWYRNMRRSTAPTLRLLDRWDASSSRTSRLFSSAWSRGAELFPSKCRAMKSFIVAPVINQYTEIDVLRIGKKGHWRLHGVAGNFITLFAERLGFRLDVTEGNPEGWGTKLPNGCWTGMFGQILKKEVDIGFGGIQPSVRVSQSFDYSLYYMWESIVFTTASPRPGLSWRSVLYPFSAEVWLCVASSFLVYAVLVGLIQFVHSYLPLPQTSDIEMLIGPFDLWRIIVGQSLRYPRGIEQRTVLGLWLFSSYITTATYTSSLVSCLTRPYYVKPPSTLKELTQSGMKLAASVGSSTIFNLSDDPIIMYLKDQLLILDYEELQTVHQTLSERGMAALALKNAIFHRNRKYIDNQAKQLHISKDEVIGFPNMFYLPRGHPCLEILNHILARSHANGLISKWYDDYAGSVGNVRNKSQRMPLKTKHMAIVLLILGSGLLLAGLVFLVELYTSRDKDARELSSTPPRRAAPLQVMPALSAQSTGVQGENSNA